MLSYVQLCQSRSAQAEVRERLVTAESTIEYVLGVMNVNSLYRSATIGGAGFWRIRRGRVSGASRAWVYLLLVASDAGLTALNSFPRRVIIGNVLDPEKRT